MAWRPAGKGEKVIAGDFSGAAWGIPSRAPFVWGQAAAAVAVLGKARWKCQATKPVPTSWIAAQK